MAEEKKEDPQAGEKKKTTLGQKFMNFLMYGGFIVILIGVVAIIVIVEMLTK